MIDEVLGSGSNAFNAVYDLEPADALHLKDNWLPAIKTKIKLN